MVQKTVTVTGNRPVSGGCWKMTLAAGADLTDPARPGQFVMVRIPDGLKPFLPRPFSIHGIDRESGGLELLYKTVGDGTRRLTTLSPGQRLSLVGPLGQGFRMDQPFEKVVLIAGGIGVAPLVFLARTMAAEYGPSLRARVFIGGATGDDLLCREAFTDLNMDVRTATDDGSVGCHGFITEPFEKAIKEDAPEMIFACGPPAMLRAVAKIAAAGNIPCQASIESIMACGIGACLGCAVKPDVFSNHYRHVCREGPVFLTSEIDFDGLIGSHGIKCGSPRRAKG